MRIIFTAPILATLLAGCGGDDKSDTSPSTTTTTTTTTTAPTTNTTTTTSTTTTTTPTTTAWCTNTLPNCPISLLDFYPLDQSTDVYYRTAIEFRFSQLGGTEDIQLTQAGLSVPGTATASIATGDLTFVPDAPLLPNTAYQVDTCTCLGQISTNWTTNDIGAPTTAVDLTDRTYIADVGAGRFVTPAGVGSLMGGLLETEMLYSVASADAAAISIVGGTGDGLGNQDICATTTTYTENADFTQNPYFATQTPEHIWNVSGELIHLNNVELTGAFAVDGSAIHGGTLSGSLDMSDLDVLVGGDACVLLATFGVPCGPCPTGPATCVDMLVDSFIIAESPGLLFEERTAIQIGDDPLCTP